MALLAIYYRSVCLNCLLQAVRCNIKRCWLQRCYMCVQSSAMSVSMLLAPAHYYRLSCAQWRRHMSVWSDTRSVQSPNDAALHVLHRARPLLLTLMYTHYNIFIIIYEPCGVWMSGQCWQSVHMFKYSGFILFCLCFNIVLLFSIVNDHLKKNIYIYILFSPTYSSQEEIFLYKHRQTHTMDCRWIPREYGNHKPVIVTIRCAIM